MDKSRWVVVLNHKDYEQKLKKLFEINQNFKNALLINAKIKKKNNLIQPCVEGIRISTPLSKSFASERIIIIKPSRWCAPTPEWVYGIDVR